VHGFARPRRHRLHVGPADLFVGLRHRIGVDAGARTNAAQTPAALRFVRPAAPAAAAGLVRRGRIVDVLDAVGRAAVALELRLDPVDRGAIAIRALTTIAEL